MGCLPSPRHVGAHDRRHRRPSGRRTSRRHRRSRLASAECGRGGVRHHHADQARRVPDQGEPDLRQPVRHVPRRERRHRRDAITGSRRPLTRGTDGQRRPATSRTATRARSRRGTSGEMDGFDQSDRRATVGLHAAPPGPAAELLALGARSTCCSTTSSPRAQGPSFPNHLYSIAAQSGGAHDNPRRRRLRPRLEHVRLRRAAATDRRGRRLRGQTRKVPPCFDFQTEGDLLSNARGIPWAYYAATERAAAATSGRRTRRSAAIRNAPERCGRSTSCPSTTCRGHPRRTGCRPSRGSRRGSSCPSTPSTTSATARTGPRR